MSRRPRCNYCAPANGSRCGAAIVTTKPELWFACTREPGHSGHHVRCDGTHALAKWPKGDAGQIVTAVVARLYREAVVLEAAA